MRTLSFIILAGGVLGAATSAAQAETDGGTASASPWSGYWWQHKTGGLTGPLKKYDRVFKSQAAPWEQTNHVAGASADWFGHCHAWSASAVCEKEPRQSRTVEGVAFGVGDQKGLLAACHAQDVANSYGDRFGDGTGADDANDIAPDELWRILQMYVKQRKIPLILDLDPGPQVWNYPVYQYRVDYQPAGGGFYDATLQLVLADNNVYPDFVGTRPILHTYTFRVKIQEGAVLSGTGKWTGASVKDHPDFAWYPYVAVAENPDVDVTNVGKVVGYAVGGSNPPPGGNPGGQPPSTSPPPEGTPPSLPPPGNGGDPPAAPPVSIEDVLSPQELLGLVLNKTSTFPLDISIDKGDGGRYRPGDPIRVSLRSGRDGYLYLFDVGAKGEVRLVFPLGGEDNRVRKDVLQDIPAKDQKPQFLAEGQGQHDLKGIVTARLIQITGFQGLPQPPAGKVKPGSAGASQLPQTQPAVPQKLLVHPAAERSIEERLLAYFRKGEPVQATAPKKLGPFAQDACAYFVLLAATKENPKKNQESPITTQQ